MVGLLVKKTDSNLLDIFLILSIYIYDIESFLFLFKILIFKKPKIK